MYPLRGFSSPRSLLVHYRSFSCFAPAPTRNRHRNKITHHILTNCILRSSLRVLRSTERQEQSCSSRDLKNRATLTITFVGCCPAKLFSGKPRPNPHSATRATLGASCLLLFLRSHLDSFLFCSLCAVVANLCSTLHRLSFFEHC